MGKRLTERIARQVTTAKGSAGSKNRALFLVLREDINEALADGWSVKLIWQTFRDEGKVTFSYQSFCNYVNQLILTEKSVSSQPNHIPSFEQPLANKPLLTSTKPTSSGFIFNPTPNLEELI